MKNLRPQSSSIWIYNSTIFSAKSIVNRIFFILFLLIDIVLCFTFFTFGTSLLFNYSIIYLIVFYLFVSLTFKFYVK